jgi:hypothetical protein
MHMKKNFVTLLLTLGSTSLFAQGPWLTTGNATAGGNFLGTVNAQPLNFRTNNTQRMTITPTGLVGVGQTTPLSLLHINSNGNAIAGELFRTSGPAGQINAWRMYTGNGNGTERFRLYSQADSNVFFQSTTANGIYGIKTGNSFTNNTRMFIAGQISGGDTTGRMALGNSLNTNFVPYERLHLNHSNASKVNIRFTNTATASGFEDGSNIGIQSNGTFRLTQFEPLNIELWTPDQTNPANQAARLRVLPNGQILVGNDVFTLNTNNAPPITNFSVAPTSLLNVKGPINSCEDVDDNPFPTILYGYTPPFGNPNLAPSRDGFRLHYNLNFRGASLDAIVLEKTDGNNPRPDGYTAFTNTGTDGVEEVSHYIDGQGRSAFGHNLLTLGNRVIIDSEWDDPIVPDATKSGLRFVDLVASTDTADLDENLGIGVLSVDPQGNVIYVPGGGGGPAAAENGTSVDNTKVVLGQTPGDPLNPGKLLNDREIPLENNEINFSGPGTLHISQGSSNLNTNAALDVNTESNTNNVAIHVRNRSFIDNSQTSKGVLVDMSFQPQNSDYAGVQIGVAGNNLSSTGAEIPNKAFLLKTYGSPTYTFDTADSTTRVAFGIEATGKVGVNIPNDEYARAAFSIQDHFGSPQVTNPYSGTFATRALLINNVNANNGDSYGIESYSRNNNTPAVGVMAIGEGTATSSGNNNSATGVQAISRANSGTNGSTRSIGVNAQAFAANGVLGSFGVSCTATGSVNNVGLRAFITNSGTFNAAVYGSSLGNGFPSGFYAGYFDGAAYVNGNLDVNGVVSASNVSPSDAGLKTDVNPIVNALDIVNALQPKSFYFDTLNAYGFHFSGQKSYGFIAQEVETILPELVGEETKKAGHDSLGNMVSAAYDYKTLNYDAFIGILTKAVQEQQQEIDAQQTELDAKDSVITALQNQLAAQDSRLAAIENCLSALNLCEMNQQAVQQTPQEIQQQLKQKISVTLSDRNTIVLSQNTPNPFAESTVIEYSIPANVQQAQIHFYDANGKLINSVNLTERGKGELTVFANDLSAGTYSYSLVTDGKTVLSKKMMKL